MFRRYYLSLDQFIQIEQRILNSVISIETQSEVKLICFSRFELTSMLFDYAYILREIDLDLDPGTGGIGGPMLLCVTPSKNSKFPNDIGFTIKY